MLGIWIPVGIAMSIPVFVIGWYLFRKEECEIEDIEAANIKAL